MNTNSLSSHQTWLPVIAATLVLAVGTPAVAQSWRRGPGSGTNLTGPVLPLPADQAKTLQFMREQEKLSRDVYQHLYEKWQLTVFNNISGSEDTHFRSIGMLLTRYNVSDPAADKQPGVYNDPALTVLYAQLVAKGSVSVKDALEVGLLIEETDIADYEKAIAASDRTDIKQVYTNLMNASYSHKEAFQTNLELACNLGL